MKARGIHRLMSAVAGVFAGTVLVAAPAAQAVTIFGIDNDPGQHLLTFDSESPALVTSVAVTGLQANEKLVGIDFRINSATPANATTLYGVGSFGRIYTINPNTGATSFVYQIAVPLNGTEFGVDFNPAADRLRIVSDLDQNLRIDLNGPGATFVDSPLTPGNPNVTNIAYDRADLSAGTPTTLFGIDTFSNQVVRIGGVDGTVGPSPSPNLGVVTPIATLNGIDPTSIGGFDIGSGSGPTGGVAYLASRNAAGGGSILSTVNLTTGEVDLVGFIGNPEDGLVIKGIAFGPGVGVPEPTALALLGLGGLGLLARRRV